MFLVYLDIFSMFCLHVVNVFCCVVVMLTSFLFKCFVLGWCLFWDLWASF